jgi:plastocyanin
MPPVNYCNKENGMRLAVLVCVAALCYSAGATTHFVRINNNGSFDPDSLVNIEGDSVRWYVTHPQPHTATSMDTTAGGLPIWDTGWIAPGDTSDPVSFDSPGIFYYYDSMRFGDVSVVVTGIILDAPGESATTPESSLLHTYPNPFNPSTTISFDLPEAGRVRLEAFDVLGRRAATILDEHRAAGSHRVVWNADGFASGVYFLKLSAGENSSTRTAVLLR